MTHSLAAILWQTSRRFPRRIRLALSLTSLLFGLVIALRIARPIVLSVLASSVLQGESGIFWGMVYAALFLVLRVCEEWKLACYYRVDQQIRRDLALRVIDGFFHIPFKQISKTASEYAIIVDRGLWAFQLIFFQLIFHLLPVICEIFIATLILSVKSGVLIGTMSFVLMMTFLVMSAIFAIKIKKKEQVFYAAETQTFQLLAESLRFYTTIRSLGVIGWTIKRYTQAMDSLITKALEYIKPQILVGLFEGVIVFGLMSMTILVIITDPGSYSDKVAQLVLVNGLLLQIVEPLKSFSLAFSSLIHSSARAHQFHEMLQLTHGPEKVGLTKLYQPHPAYCLEQFSLLFHGKIILNCPLLEIPRVPLLAITGDTGAGKTTFVKALAGLVEFAGKVSCFAATDEVYYCAQSVEIFDLTLEDNVTLGQKFSQHEIELALKRAGFSDQEKELLTGRRLGEHGEHISGGQKKRIGIARMILKKAKVMIFDEPTAELGEASAQLVTAALQALAAKSMVIVVTHDAKLIAASQMRIKIDQGMVLLED